MRNRTEGIQAAAQAHWDSLTPTEQEERTRKLGLAINSPILRVEAPIGQHCINNTCTIRIACQRFKEYLDLPAEIRNNPTHVAHYWQHDPKGITDPVCDHWVLHDELKPDKALRMGRHVQFNPRTKRHRRKGGVWDHG